LLDISEIAKHVISLTDNWKSWQFWIGTGLGVASVIFSIMAFIEAKNAKNAAIKARISLSVRNIENELEVEINLLNSIRSDITYNEMRKICLDLTSKIVRIKEVVDKLKLIDNNDIKKIDQVIDNLSYELSRVRPDFENTETTHQIFNGMAIVIADTSQLLSSIVGKIQVKNLLGDSDDK
jgi:hypothetical protein